MAALTKNNRKIPEIIRDVFRTHQTSKMELFANIVDCIQPLTIFAKYSIVDVSQGCKCASDKTKKKLGALPFASQKNRATYNLSKFLPIFNSI